MWRYLRALVLVALLQLATSLAEGRGRRALDRHHDPGPEHKRRQGFVGVKGKKDLLQDLLYPSDPYALFERPSAGLVGLRGEKSVQEALAQEYLSKRGSLLGQIDYSYGEDADSNYDILTAVLQRYLQDSEEDEAIPNSENMMNAAEASNDVEERSSELTKRAAKMSQFFGMRGKKEGRSSKRPFDLSFRGKFVGVRGKKIAGFEANEKRKGAGFYGMRGKRDYEDVFDDDIPMF